MADHSYSPAAGEIGTEEFTLVAEEIDSVTIDGDRDKQLVVTDGAAKAWFTTDGTDPEIGGGPSSWFLPAAVSSEDVAWKTNTMKIISAGTPTIRVQRRG